MENGQVNTSDCPGRPELTGFATGNLSGKHFQRIAQHIEGCSTCELALSAIDNDSDPFLSELQRSAAVVKEAGEPVPQDLLAAAQTCFSGNQNQDAGDGRGSGRLGRFELLEELGRGSFGHVFRARDTELGRDRKSTRLNSSHIQKSRMPSSA